MGIVHGAAVRFRVPGTVCRTGKSMEEVRPFSVEKISGPCVSESVAFKTMG